MRDFAPGLTHRFTELPLFQERKIVKEQLIINYVKSVRTGIYESVFAVLCGHFVIRLF